MRATIVSSCVHQNQDFSQELGSANGADAALCARAKADLAAARVALKEGTDVETARIARFEEERVKRERKVWLCCSVAYVIPSLSSRVLVQAKRGAAAGKKK